MEEIRSYWQIPSVAHFCNLFRNYLDLPDFDYEDLEFGFLSNICSENSELGLINNNLILQLIISLLKGYFETHINHTNWEQYLNKLFQIQWVCAEKKKSPFIVIDESGEEKSVRFDDLPLRTKVEIVHSLCDYRLYKEDVSELISELNVDEYRVEPLGRDSKGYVYWYFYGTRLYRENPTVALNIETNYKKCEEANQRRAEEFKRIAELNRLKAEQEEKRKALIEAKKKKEEEKALLSAKKTPKKSLPPKVEGLRTGLRQRKLEIVPNGICVNESVESSSVDSTKSQKKEIVKTVVSAPIKQIFVSLKERNEAWTLICQNQQEWTDLAEKFKNSKNKCEIEFYKLLSESFVPKICEIFAKVEREKFKVEKQKLFDLLPRRISSRIELKKVRKEKEQMEEEETKKRKIVEEDNTSVRQRSERVRQERELRVQKRLQLAQEREARLQRKVQRELNPLNEDSEQSDETSPQLQFNFEEFIEINPKDMMESFYEGLEKVINSVKSNRDAWPFREAVDGKAFPMYYQVIEEPIDLSIIEQKIENREYEKFEEIERDFKLMVNNCETFNGPKNGYTLMSYGVWRAFKRASLKYLERELSFDESHAFIYPPKVTNTNIKPAIEAKKKKSRNKRRSTFKALNVLAEAAEKAVEANDRIGRMNASSASSVAESSPRSSISYEEQINESLVQENGEKIQVHGDMLARFLFNANHNNNNNNNNNNLSSLPNNTSTHENLTFKSLDEWSKSIKQSGNAVILPQHAVIISSPQFRKSSTNGPLVKSEEEQRKLISLKVVSTGNEVSTNTKNVNTITNTFTSSVISNNENAQKELVNVDPKRLVIKLSRCESGQVWKPVKLITNSALNQNDSTVSNNELSTQTVTSTQQQFQGLRNIPNNCVPVKKRFFIQSFNDKQPIDKLYKTPTEQTSVLNINAKNPLIFPQMVAIPKESTPNSHSFQITGLQHNQNSNLKVLRLKKIDQSSTVSKNTLQPDQNCSPFPKVLLLPLAKPPLNVDGLSSGPQQHHFLNSHKSSK